MKILVIRPGAMGDVCLALPLVRALAQVYEVHWLIRRHYAPLVACFPDVGAHLIPTDLDDAIVPTLQHARYDAVIDLSHWPEVSRLVAQLPDVPLRAITYDPDQDARLGVKRQGMDLYAPFNCRVAVDSGTHQVERWQRLIRVALGERTSALPPLAPGTPGERGRGRGGRAGGNVTSNQRQRTPHPRPLSPEYRGEGGRLPLRLFLHPHAGKPTKWWPIRHYVEVLSTLSRRLPLDCWINCGNRPEWLRALSLWTRLRLRGIRAHLLPRDRTYRRLVTALPTMDLALGSDSGPMHLASLLGVPTVVLFGPYPASEFSPPWRSRPVNPAFPGAAAATIAVADVLDALHEMTGACHAA